MHHPALGVEKGNKRSKSKIRYMEIEREGVVKRQVLFAGYLRGLP